MLYMVIVNRKYMVTVEACSCREAEKKLRSSVEYGVDEIVSFDPVRQSESYQWAYESCESISLRDMETASNRYKAWLMRQYNKMLVKEDELQRTVDTMEASLQRVREELRIQHNSAEAYRRNNGLQKRMTPMSEIMELERLI